MQEVTAEDPWEGPKEPAGQGVAMAVPRVGQKKPAGHVWQAAAPGTGA